MGDVLNIKIIWKHSTCYFLIGNKTFIEPKKKIEHHVHNGEHFEQ